MQRIFKYGLAVIRSNKLLVVRKTNTDRYLLPGGKPKEGETAEECLAREIKEELNANLNLDSIRSYGLIEDNAANEPNTIIQVSLYLGDIDGRITSSSEISDIAWVGRTTNLLLAPSIQNKILPDLINNNIIT